MDTLRALDIKQLGTSLDDLFSWLTVMQVDMFANAAEEAAAQRNPVAMARRYNAVALRLKQVAIILRLQTLEADVNPQRTPNKVLVDRISNLGDQVAKDFAELQKALGGTKILPDLARSMTCWLP